MCFLIALLHNFWIYLRFYFYVFVYIVIVIVVCYVENLHFLARRFILNKSYHIIILKLILSSVRFSLAVAVACKEKTNLWTLNVLFRLFPGCLFTISKHSFSIYAFTLRFSSNEFSLEIYFSTRIYLWKFELFGQYASILLSICHIVLAQRNSRWLPFFSFIIQFSFLKCRK